MSKQNHHRKKQRETEKNITQSFVQIPNHQSQKKRQAGVSGKEKIVAGKNAVKSFSIEKHRTDYRMSGEGTDVGEADKNRSD